MYQIFPDDVLGSGQFGIVYGGKIDLRLLTSLSLIVCAWDNLFVGVILVTDYEIFILLCVLNLSTNTSVQKTFSRNSKANASEFIILK